MKKLQELKTFNNKFIDSFNKLYSELQDSIKEIKQEYNQTIIDEKIKLLIEICNGEELNIDEIKNKYLKPKELSSLEPISVHKNIITIDDDLLDKIVIDNQSYYYTPIKDSIVYNTNNQPVGQYKNGSVVLN